MTEPAREQLLGYLLGALEENEQADIEELLDSDARLQHDLAIINRALSSLDATRCEFKPPQGLAARTCEFVAQNGATTSTHTAAPDVEMLTTTVSADTFVDEQDEQQNSDLLHECVQAAAQSTPSQTAAKMHPVEAKPCQSGRARWQDSIMAVGIMFMACGLLFPAIMDSRERARLMTCQNNLKDIGTALTSYSENNKGYFPAVPSRGKLAAAGIYAPRLAQDGYLQNAHQVICPGSTLADERDFSIPTLDDLQAVSDSDELATLRNRMGGSYGYTLGHMDNGRYSPTKNLHRENFAIMADSPSHALPSHQSNNHGGNGQNVLFEDGHVGFLPTPRPQGLIDDVFTNDEGRVAAGVHANDSVIGNSGDAPFTASGYR